MPKASKPEPTPTHCLTVEDWAARPQLRAELANLLSQPVARMAFQTLLMGAMPRSASAVNPMPSVRAEAMDKTLAYAFQSASGFVRFHDRLHRLSTYEGKSKTAVDFSAWGSLQKEDE